MRSSLKFFSLLYLLTFCLIPTLSTADAKSVSNKSDALIPPAAMEMSNYMSAYYKKPQPELLGKAMKNFSSLEPNFKMNASAPFSAFMSILFSKFPDKVPGWIKEMSFKDQTDRGVVCYALWIANNDVCRAQMKLVAQGMEGKRKEAILALVNKKPDNLKTMNIETPADLDKFWAAFMATGDRIYVERIMSVIPELNGHGERIIIAGAARWSLVSNIQQHDLVKRIAQDEVKKHPEYKAFLKDVKLD